MHHDWKHSITQQSGHKGRKTTKKRSKRTASLITQESSAKGGERALIPVKVKVTPTTMRRRGVERSRGAYRKILIGRVWKSQRDDDRRVQVRVSYGAMRNNSNEKTGKEREKAVIGRLKPSQGGED